MTSNLVTYGLAINAFALVLCIFDKGFAVYNRKRVPEGFLLFLAFIGGAVGAKLAQILTGHKSLKIDFCASLSLIVFLQLGFAAAIWSETVRESANDLYQRFAVLLDDEAEETRAERVTRVSKDAAMPRRFGPGS
ncbi:MAG: DUF1294 domain-containing protein [Pseudomonadota bacterium]